MSGRNVIVLGASAGGVHALSEVVGALPAHLPASVFVVLHIAPHGQSAMPAILTRAGCLPAKHPRDGEPVQHGHIYVAPPDQHILLQDGVIRLSRAPTENGQRPAVDVLFRSAALTYGRRVVAVVLTGNLDDGTIGLAVVKKYGGVAVVQDPEQADYPSMPLSATQHVAVDHVLPLCDIAPLLVELASQPLPEEAGPLNLEGRDMKEELERGIDKEDEGIPADLSCPDCGGGLRESLVNGVVHFRCRTGHAYGQETLLAKQSDVIEGALWAAVRALQENAALARRMERRMRQSGKVGVMIEERYQRRAQEAERHAEVLRKLLMQDEVKTG